METDNKNRTFEAFNPGLMLIVLIKVNISVNCSNSKDLLKMPYLKCMWTIIFLNKKMDLCFKIVFNEKIWLLGHTKPMYLMLIEILLIICFENAFMNSFFLYCFLYFVLQVQLCMRPCKSSDDSISVYKFLIN